MYTGTPGAVISVPQSASQRPPTRLGPQIQVTKISLPTFIGHRKNWPEFTTHELKRSVKGETSTRTRSVYFTKLEAYDVMWQKLENYYENVGASVQAALEDLHKLKEFLMITIKG